ncbi:MAG: hypothetical protein Q7K57_34515 [Burkholderiaceae bacterium]|nr:hypothetical protein [Burkholderiaceae bacterium]
MPTHSGYLVQRLIQIFKREVLKHVGGNDDIELGVTKHWHVMTASDYIRLKGFVNIKGGDVASSPP